MNSKPFEIVKYMLGLFGTWEPPGSSKHYGRKVIFVIVYIIFNTTCFLGLYSEIGNGNLEVVCSKMAMFTVGGYASTVILLHNTKEYQSWLTEMFANEQFMNNHPNSKLRILYRSTIKNIWPSLLVNMNQWALGTAVVIFAAIMVLFINDRLEHVDKCGDMQKNCSMVLMGYYYFPWDAGEHYWLANMEDVVFGAMCGIFAITRDIFFASYICYLICRLSLLSYVVGHLEEFIDGELDMMRNFDQKIDHLLGQCVKEHQDIIREFFILKKNSSKMFLVMLLVHAPAVANITLTIFKESDSIYNSWSETEGIQETQESKNEKKNEGDSTSAFALFVYCAAFYGCTHLYLILSLSEQLSTECAHLATSIHFLKWYKLNIKQQKVLKFMLVRAQKPFVLTCGALFPANLSTFTKTMRAIYTILNAFINLSK